MKPTSRVSLICVAGIAIAGFGAAIMHSRTPTLVVGNNTTGDHTKSLPKTAADMPKKRPTMRSGDLAQFRRAMQRNPLDPRIGRFRVGTVMVGDYDYNAPDVGGEAANGMTFFANDDGNYYRVFSPDRIVRIEKPAPWISGITGPKPFGVRIIDPDSRLQKQPVPFPR